MKKELLLTMAVLALVSCKDEEISNEIEEASSKVTICRNSDNEAATGLKAVSYKPVYFWDKGQTITVAFYNGTAAQKREFMNCCYDWMAYANVYFSQIGSTSHADVRVSFEPGYGEGKSIVGNGSLDDKSRPSMHLMVNNLATTDTLFRQTVRHELGHVLGLAHEHQHPQANISFNKSEVMRDYGITEQEYVDNFVKLNKSVVDYVQYDPNSIMHYEFYPKYTTNGKMYYSKSNLSAIDKSYIGQLYPMDGTKRIYTFYIDNHHLHTTAANNLETHRDVLQNTLGRIEQTKKAGTTAIYMYYNTIVKDNLYTTNKSEVTNGKDGWVYKGILGYGYTSKAAGRVPVYRFFSSSKAAHMLSNNQYANAGGGGYISEGLLFYVNK